MDIVHDRSSDDSVDRTPDVLVAKLAPFDEMEEKYATFQLNNI